MIIIKNYKGLDIRITDERIVHIENDHPEMSGLIHWIEETLLTPDKVILSNTDSSVELYYRLYEKTPVTRKYLCVLVKNNKNDYFVITSYFTDSIKRGEVHWEKK